MRNKKLEEILAKGLLVTESILLIIFLFWRFKLGMIRYFDVDEFAHLHWSHNLLSGLRPYTDFFYFFPPLFLYILAPLFLFSVKSINILLLGRGLSFGVFLLVLLTLFLLVKKIKNSQTAFLSVLVLAFLPIPSDKWIEIRPDGVATLFSLLGILCLVEGIRKDKRQYFFLSGLFYAVSVLIIPKVLPLAIVGTLVVVIYYIVNGGSYRLGITDSSTIGTYRLVHPIGGAPSGHLAERVFKAFCSLFIADSSTSEESRSLPRHHPRCLYRLLFFISGSLIPIIIVVLLFISYGDAAKAFYLTTKISTAATQVLGQKFPIGANFLFYPNDVYYGAPGYSLPWLINLIVWIIAIVWGVIRLVSFLLAKDRKESLVNLLLSSSFIVSLIVFVKFLTLRHGQYLIPISVFVAYYFADFVVSFFDSSSTGGIPSGYPRGVLRLFPIPPPQGSHGFQPATPGVFLSLYRLPQRSLDRLLSPVVLTVLLLVIFFSAKEMYGWKLRWVGINFSYYDTLFKLLPKGERVYDLTGEAVFSADGYYFCCIPYGQYEEALLFQYPNLENTLRRNNIRFVYMQNEGRLSVLPPSHEKVIRRYYTIYPVGTPPFLLVAGALVGFEKEGLEKEFDLIAEGSYSLLWNYKVLNSEEAGKIVTIDDKIVTKVPIRLSSGKHTMKVMEGGLMKVMYAW